VDDFGIGVLLQQRQVKEDDLDLRGENNSSTTGVERGTASGIESAGDTQRTAARRRRGDSLRFIRQRVTARWWPREKRRANLMAGIRLERGLRGNFAFIKA